MKETAREEKKKMKCPKWVLVVAARPNFMKIAPLLRAIKAYNVNTLQKAQSKTLIQPFLVHTGQHYDDDMSGTFFRDLGIPEPNVHLGIGSGSHAKQTGRVMIEFEKVLEKEKPNLVIVVGDVNSTLACSLAAAKLRIPVAHVEAGLRSFDRTMPEEINRIVTDVISDYLFTPSPDADKNLLHEGISKEKIFLVGDIMADSLLFNLEKANETGILERLGLKSKSATSSTIAPYGVLTLHRPANVDNPEILGKILKGLQKVALKIPILFPIHPRTKKRIQAFGMEDAFVFPKAVIGKGETVWHFISSKKIRCIEPLGYLDFLNLMSHAKLVLTDSGGIQEETTVLNIPCITIRDTTERPITLTEGTNVLVGNNPAKIASEANRALSGYSHQTRSPVIWDGHTAERIVRILAK